MLTPLLLMLIFTDVFAHVSCLLGSAPLFKKMHVPKRMFVIGPSGSSTGAP